MFDAPSTSPKHKAQRIGSRLCPRQRTATGSSRKGGRCQGRRFRRHDVPIVPGRWLDKPAGLPKHPLGDSQNQVGDAAPVLFPGTVSDLPVQACSCALGSRIGPRCSMVSAATQGRSGFARSRTPSGSSKPTFQGPVDRVRPWNNPATCCIVTKGRHRLALGIVGDQSR